MDHLRAVPSDAPSSEGASEGGLLADLLARAGRGDTQAFAQFYDATATRSYGLALRVVRDPSQAEEVVQEVYLDAWRQSGRYDAGRGSVMSWLLTIVHRRAVDRVRSAEAANRRDATYHQQHNPIAHDATAEAAEASLDAHRVRTAMQELTSIQREALELAYFGGYTHTEVATMLDLPVGTAKTRIRDGLIRMRDALGVTTT